MTHVHIRTSWRADAVHTSWCVEHYEASIDIYGEPLNLKHALCSTYVLQICKHLKSCPAVNATKTCPGPKWCIWKNHEIGLQFSPQCSRKQSCSIQHLVAPQPCVAASCAPHVRTKKHLLSCRVGKWFTQGNSSGPYKKSKQTNLQGRLVHTLGTDAGLAGFTPPHPAQQRGSCFHPLQWTCLFL
jgi:hypothetical protein